MSEKFFSDRPNVELLQWLARGSLKQNLLRAIRLWVWLQFLYGEEKDRSRPCDPFTYASWRDAFFNSNHPKGEEIPKFHSPGCTCARSTADWLFNALTGVSEPEWRQSLRQHDAIPDVELDELLQQRLFGITRRSLYADLQILVELGWIKRKGVKYYRVDHFPVRPVTRDDASLTIDLNPLETDSLSKLAALMGMSKEDAIRQLIRNALVSTQGTLL